jgi:hypothetical protein
MNTTWFLALALVVAGRGAIGDQAAEARSMLQLSGPTYFADGEIRGATAGFALKLNQPLEVYQTSGRTLCESSSAITAKPGDAGSGWRLVILPLKLGRELVLSVNWQRLWERGQTLANGPKGSAVVTLQPGQYLMLDYITAGELTGASQGVAWRPGDPNRPAVRSSLECNAIGMGLRIELPPVESESIVDTSLWLVRTLADGSERPARQTLRTRVGTTTEFFFDDEEIVLSLPSAGRGASTPPIERIVRTHGWLRPLDVANGQVRMEILIAQYLSAGPGSSGPMPGGSATYEFTAGPDEVISFQVPRGADDAGRVGDRMSLRIQMRAIR